MHSDLSSTSGARYLVDTCDVFARETFRPGGFAIETLLLLLQLCEGHNGTMQDFLRVQPRLTSSCKTVNLVQQTAEFAHRVDSLLALQAAEQSIQDEWAKVAIQLLRTLTEYIQGCAGNQVWQPDLFASHLLSSPCFVSLSLGVGSI